MGALGRYALQLIAGALICGILLSIVPAGSCEKLLRLLCGIFLTVILLSPLTNIQLDLELDLFHDAIEEGRRQAASGVKLARQERLSIISQGLEAYILDKAGQKGADLHVTVTLNENGLPVEVELRGKSTEKTRQELTDMIAKDLGIAKENQRWMP